MITQELLTYIKAERQKGTEPHNIASDLTNQGWEKQDIQSAFQQLGYNISPNLSPHLKPIVIIVFVVLLFVAGLATVFILAKQYATPQNDHELSSSKIPQKKYGYENQAFGFALDTEGFVIENNIDSETRLIVKNDEVATDFEIITGLNMPDEGVTKEWLDNLVSEANNTSSQPTPTPDQDKQIDQILVEGKQALKIRTTGNAVEYFIPLTNTSAVNIKLASKKLDEKLDNLADTFLERFHYIKQRNQNTKIQLENKACGLTLKFPSRWAVYANIQNSVAKLSPLLNKTITPPAEDGSCNIMLTDPNQRKDFSRIVLSSSEFTLMINGQGNSSQYDSKKASDLTFLKLAEKVEIILIKVGSIDYPISVMHIKGDPSNKLPRPYGRGFNLFKPE